MSEAANSTICRNFHGWGPNPTPVTIPYDGVAGAHASTCLCIANSPDQDKFLKDPCHAILPLRFYGGISYTAQEWSRRSDLRNAMLTAQLHELHLSYHEDHYQIGSLHSPIWRSCSKKRGILASSMSSRYREKVYRDEHAKLHLGLTIGEPRDSSAVEQNSSYSNVCFLATDDAADKIFAI